MENSQNFVFQKRRDGTEKYPLLDFQDLCLNGIDFLDGYHMEKFDLNCSFGLRLRGKVNGQRLNKVIQRLYDENDAFRSIFFNDNGEKYFKVLRHYQYDPTIIEIEGETAEVKFEKFKQMKEEESGITSDVYNEVPAVFQVYRFADDDYCVFIRLNHIIADGVSIGLIVKKFFVGYFGLGMSLIGSRNSTSSEYFS